MNQKFFGQSKKIGIHQISYIIENSGIVFSFANKRNKIIALSRANYSKRIECKHSILKVFVASDKNLHIHKKGELQC